MARAESKSYAWTSCRTAKWRTDGERQSSGCESTHGLMAALPSGGLIARGTKNNSDGFIVALGNGGLMTRAYLSVPQPHG